jgi:glycosyltransferase involved in cell wall biosynthesis
MAVELTVIVPCYNCAATLEEAVASIYIQGLQMPFEVVMVDDGSTDNTQSLIEDLSKRYSYVRYYFHDRNRGGGAARNTAIEKSTGRYIFCLDSDDILTPGMLNRMLDYAGQKRCDGVGISKSIKFRNRNPKDIVYITDFDYIGQQIPLHALWNGSSCALFSTFLHTRETYNIIGGYPTDHGFDTQGFAFRFLTNGLSAYTCPDTTYLHRISFHKSYYVREFEAGKSIYNWFKILEEVLYLFEDKVKAKILAFDIFTSNPFSDSIMNILKQDMEHLLIDGYVKLVRPYAIKAIRENFMARLDTLSMYDVYWLGVIEEKTGNYELAANFFVKAICMGIDNTHAYRHLIKSLSDLTGSNYDNLIDRVATEHFRPTMLVPSLPFRAVRKLQRMILARRSKT